MNTEKALRTWLREDADRWDPPAMLMGEVLAIPTMQSRPSREWSTGLAIIVAGILLLLALLVSALLAGAFNNRSQSIIPSPPSRPSVFIVAPFESEPPTFTPILALPTTSSPSGPAISQSPVTGPLTQDNGLVVAWYSFYCTVGSQATVIDKVLIEAISHCPTKAASSVLWTSDTPGQWNNSLRIDNVDAVGIANETYVGNDQNDSHPFSDFANVYGRPSPIQPTQLPSQGADARVRALAYLKTMSNGYLAVGVDTQPGIGIPEGVIWSSRDGTNWTETPGPLDAADLTDAVPGDQSFLVLGYRASDRAPAVWRLDDAGWGPGVALTDATQSPDLTLVDSDTAMDASHLWTGLSGQTPSVSMFPAGYSMTTVVRVADGYIAVGVPAIRSAKDAVLVSTDGATWRLTAFNPDFARFKINSLVEASSQVVGLGGAEFVGPDRVAAYELR